MARALRIQIAGGFYHVTCRGNERKAIYRDDTDRQVFLDKLQGSLTIYQVELHAYVLMEWVFRTIPAGYFARFRPPFSEHSGPPRVGVKSMS